MCLPNCKKKLVLILHRVFVCLLCSSLSLVPNSRASGNYQEYIRRTHRLADEAALRLVNQVMLDAMHGAFRVRVDLNEDQLRQVLNQSGSILDSSLVRMRTLGNLPPVALSRLTAQQLETIRADHRRLIQNVRRVQLDLADRRLAVNHGRSLVRGTVSAFLQNLGQVCREGLMTDIQTSGLLPIPSVIPHFEFRGNFGGGLDGSDPNAGGWAQVGDGSPENIATWALVHAGSTILAGYLITGKVILTGSALAASGAALAILATGVLITAVIAAIVFLGGRQRAITESERAAGEAASAFLRRAGPEHVAERFRFHCDRVMATLASLPLIFDRIERGDQLIMAELDTARATLGREMQAIQQASSAHNRKFMELLGTRRWADLKSEDQNEIRRRLNESEEGRAWHRISESFTNEKTTDLVRFSFMNTYAEAERVAQTYGVAVQRLQERINMDQLLAQQEQLRQITELKHRQEFESATQGLLARQDATHREIREILLDFDRSLLARAQWIARGDFSPEATAEYAQWEIFFERTAERLEALRVASPQDPVLQAIWGDFRRFRNLSRSLP